MRILFPDFQAGFALFIDALNPCGDILYGLQGEAL